MSVVQFFRTLRGLSGSNAKAAHLRTASSNPLVKDILKYTYEPRWKYGLKEKSLPTGHSLNGASFEDIQGRIFKCLDRLADKSLTGGDAKSTVASILGTLSGQDAELFKMIILKDLRSGVSATTINKAIPGLISVFKFMKAKVYQEGDVKKHGYLYGSLKIDCIRGLLRDGALYSTGGKLIDGVQHLVESMPKDLELDSEITIPGLDFDAASGLIRSKKDCPTAVLNVFDVINTDPFDTRLEYMQELDQYLFSHMVNVQLIKHSKMSSDEAIFRNFGKALDAKFEGLVLKTPKHKYQLKRSADWLKVKAEDPEDVKIVGFNEGTGKYEGTLGALVCLRANGAIVKVSGFPDAFKHKVWNNKNNYMDTFCAIKYHQETPDGSLRHPRYFRDRWDKTEF